jgi:hypothetical protein
MGFINGLVHTCNIVCLELITSKIGHRDSDKIPNYVTIKTIVNRSSMESHKSRRASASSASSSEPLEDQPLTARLNLTATEILISRWLLPPSSLVKVFEVTLSHALSMWQQRHHQRVRKFLQAVLIHNLTMFLRTIEEWAALIHNLNMWHLYQRVRKLPEVALIHNLSMLLLAFALIHALRVWRQTHLLLPRRRAIGLEHSWGRETWRLQQLTWQPSPAQKFAFVRLDNRTWEIPHL